MSALRTYRVPVRANAVTAVEVTITDTGDYVGNMIAARDAARERAKALLTGEWDIPDCEPLLPVIEIRKRVVPQEETTI